MMAANVGTREEDMTGRSKTQKDAIETITLLLAAGADVNAADTQGRTAAHGAALWGLDRRRPVPARERRQARRQGQARLHAARHRAGAGRRLRLRPEVARGARGNRQSHPRADRRPTSGACPRRGRRHRAVGRSTAAERRRPGVGRSANWVARDGRAQFAPAPHTVHRHGLGGRSADDQRQRITSGASQHASAVWCMRC